MNRGDTPLAHRVIGVSLNAAVDKTTSVDRLAPGDIHRPVILSVVPGGKAANVVRAGQLLGLQGEIVAVLGGHAGAWYRAALAERSIPLHAVEVAGETRTCLSVLDVATGDLTEFYEPGIVLDDGDWPRVEAALEAALGAHGGDAVVVLAGSLPPGAPVDAYARLARVSAEHGARAVIDVDGPPLVAALAVHPWMVKLNAREAELLTGTSARTRDRATAAARAILGMGATIAIVTRGVHGAVLATADGAWLLGPVPAAHRGPFSVGSGDAFLAGLLAGLAQGGSVADALRLAGAAGAANARVAGQGELDRTEVARTRKACSVTAIPG